MLNILVIEANIKIANKIAKNLENQDYLVEQVFNGLCGRRLAHEKDFDLIISELNLPVLNGMDFCRELKQLKPYVPIIMLADSFKALDKTGGLYEFADEYIIKPFDPGELIVRMTALLKRFKTGTQFQGPVLKYADLEMNLQSKSVNRNGINIDLSPKEFNLLEFFLRNPERVISRNELAEKVWNISFDTGTNYIDVYINYLRKKIDNNFDVKLIRTRPGMGFILKTEN